MKRLLSGILGFRVAYGAALLVAPDKVTKSWLGSLDDASRVALRGLGAREVGLHVLAIAAVLNDAPVKPLLAASIAGDRQRRGRRPRSAAVACPAARRPRPPRSRAVRRR